MFAGLARERSAYMWGAFLPMRGWLQRETPRQMIQTILENPSHAMHGYTSPQ
ncbi:MAG: hypothetical protein QXS12_04900 [Candidatus Caldarchaeum sp.]